MLIKSYILLSIVVVTLTGTVSCDSNSTTLERQLPNALASLDKSWTKFDVPPSELASLVVFGRNDDIVLTGTQSILFSSSSQKKLWKPIAGEEAIYSTSFDGGLTFQQKAKNKFNVRNLIFAYSALIDVSKDRLYINGGSEHNRSIWSVPINQPENPRFITIFSKAIVDKNVSYSLGKETKFSNGKLIVTTSSEEQGIVLASSDDGANWLPVWKNNKAILAFDFFDGINGRLIDANGDIFSSSDGGMNWGKYANIFLLKGYKKSLSLKFWDEKKGYAVGNNGLILTTSDGGISWIRADSPVLFNLLKVEIGTDKNAWITGENGTILETTNSGETWNVINLGIKESFIYGLTIKNGKPWVAAGEVFYTKE